MSKSPVLLCTSLVFLLSACSAESELDKWGKPTLEGTGYQEEPGGKADGLTGLKGPSAAFDEQATQVWPVENRWHETNTTAARKAGVAWGQDSGLSWDEKYRLWVESMERSDDTMMLTTPWGKSLPAPDLECAEVAMFLRITFASWYHLPFFMEARDSSSRIFFGHMGIITPSGNRWRQMPNFKTRYPDFSHMDAAVRADLSAWPSDSTLSNRKIGGNSGDFQTAIDAEHAGAYFDEIFLNKRVGYFLTIQLAYQGSVSLADSANTFNVAAHGFGTGDFLVERTDFNGIGHTIVIKKILEFEETVTVGELTANIREVEVMSGSMPRRQPLWEDSSTGRSYFIDEWFGGEETVEFGAGLKRFRSAAVVGGKWTNVVLPAYAGHWINSNNHDQLVERQTILAELLPQPNPQRRIDAFAAKVEREREWLREHPSSCASRIRREAAFREVYEGGRLMGFSQEQMDAKYRALEDYVFAELEYDESKTCCWNSSTAQMHQAVMKYNLCVMGEAEDEECDAITDHEVGTCQPAVPFMNRDDAGDGYKVFADFAAANGYPWVAWSADENCPQADVAEDTVAESSVTDYCVLSTIDVELHCEDDQFLCGDGQCISASWRCDRESDCSDGADEADCPAQECGDDEFSCDNGQCVPNDWRCDGDNDCGDMSDENLPMCD